MMVATEPVMQTKKLKIKFGSQRAVEFVRQVSVSDENDLSGLKKLQKPDGCASSEMSLNADLSNKRGPQELAEDQPTKRQKMDRNISRHCSMLLKTLLQHSFGWPFKQPVDPVKLNIPDYFSVISKPMDLGTIKSKLAKNAYIGMEDFAADIRLTFSNAMLYNPPSNEVHVMAKTLNEIFEARLKSVEKKWKSETSKPGVDGVLRGQMRDDSESGRNGPETSLLSTSSLLKRSKPAEEKVKRVSLDERSMAVTTKVNLTKPDQNPGANLVGKCLSKGTNDGGIHDLGSEAGLPLSSAAYKCGSCGSLTCHCICSSNSACATSSDITSERCWRDNASYASTTDCQAKCMSPSQVSKLDPDSDGAVSSLYDENTCPSSQPTIPATDAVSGGAWTAPIVNVPLSPKKALRAAMLKSRFADTILKAKQRTLLDHSNKKADPVKLQQERERLERRHREEKARFEAEIRAAEAASRIREEMELKRKREKERESARLALQKMEEAIEIEENLEVEKELVMLCGADLVRQARRGAQLLEQLGLFMKDDCSADEAEEVMTVDGEEGEIIS